MYKEIFEIDKKYPSLIMKIVSKSNHTLKYFFKDVMFNWTFLYIARKFFLTTLVDFISKTTFQAVVFIRLVSLIVRNFRLLRQLCKFKEALRSRSAM